MSISKYKFVSPGVYINEIDNTQLPAATPAMGPVIIGRTERGPGMRPIKVNSFSEYIEVFGNPVPGGKGGDVWRDGNYASPMYATYAAQAWLANGQTATIIRLLGSENLNKDAGETAGYGNYTRSAAGGGSYGLFLIQSGSTDYSPSNPESVTGTLAAVWHFPSSNGGIMLSGNYVGTTTKIMGNGKFVNSMGNQYNFKATVVSGASSNNEVYDFNFDVDSDKYIRKVFNTNPALTNTGITESGNQEKYWLGSTFERGLRDKVSDSGKNTVHGIILAMDAINDWSHHRMDAKVAHSGWVISQQINSDTGSFDPFSTTYVTKLFKLHSRDAGEWSNANLKISFANIMQSTNTDVDGYGTFDVIIRRAQDSDSNIQIIEQFGNCNLNPQSPNYIARRIGDQYAQWDDTERRFRTYGDYPNASQHIRVEMNNEVAQGATDPALLPFGFHGPFKPSAFKIGGQPQSGVLSQITFATSSATMVGEGTTSELTSESVVNDGARIFVGHGESFATSSFIYPSIALRASSSDSGLASDSAAFFGYDSRQKGSERFDRSNIDLCRILPNNLTDSTDNIVTSIAFTLDDIKITQADSSGKNGLATYSSGSRRAGTSATALSGAYTSIIDNHSINKFTMPMWGGFDGFDLTETDPLANRNIGASEKASYEYNTIRRGIDACADPEEVDFNLMVAPGVTNESITDLMITTCENRGDALAIIDLPNVYKPQHEGSTYGAFASRLATKLDATALTFKNRKKNSSYGCTYYPWVQIRDSFNNASVWVPPSVVALGTFAHSDRVGELWFAPAGFNRGGLSQGSSGLTVTNITERLTSGNRDDLYASNINPIASFPNEGIVVFGQKTLDATTSALSRINVRRLLIFLKKEISRLANQVLFDNNVPATWARFEGLVRPVLESVKIRFGLSDYKLVLDETTTTPDLIDRNIMYAKIFLKPARAIEFIALDFVITSTGASFDD